LAKKKKKPANTVVDASGAHGTEKGASLLQIVFHRKKTPKRAKTGGKRKGGRERPDKNTRPEEGTGGGKTEGEEGSGAKKSPSAQPLHAKPQTTP